MEIKYNKYWKKIKKIPFFAILVSVIALALSFNASAKTFAVQNESAGVFIIGSMIFLTLSSLNAIKSIKEKKRAQQSRANLLNLSNSLRPEATRVRNLHPSEFPDLLARTLASSRSNPTVKYWF